MEKPGFQLFLLAGALSLNACDKTEKPETDVSFVADTRVSVERQIQTAEIPIPPKPECPPEMVNVNNIFCIDRVEASLIEMKQERSMYPYYSHDFSILTRDYSYWIKMAGSSEKPDGSVWDKPLLDSVIQIPAPPAWQMKEGVLPKAVSKKNVLPNGYLNYYVAKQACENAGKRLCMKAEWETACRGEGDRLYPYGSEYQQGQCNIFRWSHPALLLHGSAAINHTDPRLHLMEEKPGKPLLRKTGATVTCISQWGEDGISDMVGNLDEWVEGDTPSFKGGFYSRVTKKGCDATFGKGHVKGYYDYSLGVRCCKDLKDGENQH